MAGCDDGRFAALQRYGTLAAALEIREYWGKGFLRYGYRYERRLDGSGGLIGLLFILLCVFVGVLGILSPLGRSALEISMIGSIFTGEKVERIKITFGIYINQYFWCPFLRISLSGTTAS